jgi:hypothetical protein
VRIALLGSQRQSRYCSQQCYRKKPHRTNIAVADGPLPVCCQSSTLRGMEEWATEDIAMAPAQSALSNFFPPLYAIPQPVRQFRCPLA